MNCLKRLSYSAPRIMWCSQIFTGLAYCCEIGILKNQISTYVAYSKMSRLSCYPGPTIAGWLPTQVSPLLVIKSYTPGYTHPLLRRIHPRIPGVPEPLWDVLRVYGGLFALGAKCNGVVWGKNQRLVCFQIFISR